MTIWYRAAPTKNRESTFSGEGGLYVAGRWNHLGKKIVYCSESIALCTLEWLSHNGLSLDSFSYYRYSIDIPDNLIKRISLVSLPKDWNTTPATDLTRDFAEKELFSASDLLALAVPSVIVPEEFNLIINPEHYTFIHATKTIKMLGQHVAPNR